MIRKEIQKIIDNIDKFKLLDQNMSFAIDLEFVNDSENKERILIKFENLGLFDRKIGVLFWEIKKEYDSYSYYPSKEIKLLREEKRVLFKVISKILKQFNKEKKEKEILLGTNCLSVFDFKKGKENEAD